MGKVIRKRFLGTWLGVSTLACMTAGDWDRSDMELCLRESVPGRRGSWARESVRVSGPRGPGPGSCPRDPPPPPPGLIISCRTELWSRASVTSLRDLDSCTTEYNQIKLISLISSSTIYAGCFSEILKSVWGYPQAGRQDQGVSPPPTPYTCAARL